MPITARQVFEAVLVEMNKVQAPSLLLEDFNYLFNKAINQYINKRYNIYDVNQQTTDDLRVLKSSVTLRALNDKSTVNDVTVRDSMYGAIYEFALPADYLHLLNCVCNFKVNKPFKCYNANTYVQFPATRLTSDMWSQIITNFYMRPTYKRPYYFIHNVNSYPADSQYTTFQPEGGFEYGNKINYEGNFGRVPSENIYLPTDGGNTDIQHLKTLTDPSANNSPVKDRFGNTYTDDNNHYDKDYKYGIPRYLDFSEPEINNENFLWRRTGKGIIFANVDITGDGKAEKVILGDLNFKPKQYTVDTVDLSGKQHSRGDFYQYSDSISNGLYTDMQTPVKVTINNSVVEHIGSFITEVNGKATQEYDSHFQDAETSLQYVINGQNVIVGTDNAPIKVEWEWVPLLKHTKYNSVEKVGEVRYGNPSTVRLEIRYGKDNSLFTLDSVYVDYIKSPQYIRITQEQLDLTEDTSQIMEFPDYVIQEIINELVHIVMENSGDARLQTHIPISQSVANPAQQQEAPATTSRKR